MAVTHAIIVSPDGIQRSQDVPTPVPFSFEQDVLGDGPFNPRIAGVLIELVMRDLFPEPADPPLFRWDTLSPTMMMTIASAYYILNEKGNPQPKAGQVAMIPDEKIKERIARRGVLTPYDIAQGKHRGPQRYLDTSTGQPVVGTPGLKNKK